MSTNQIALPFVPPQLPQIPVVGGGGIIVQPRQEFHPTSALPIPHETSVLPISQPQIEAHYTPNTSQSSDNLQPVMPSSGPLSSASCTREQNLCSHYTRLPRFTQLQIDELSRVFQHHAYPSLTDRRELAQRTGLTVDQVSIRLIINTAF